MNEEPKYCCLCNKKLSMYNYTGKCWHHEIDEAIEEFGEDDYFPNHKIPIYKSEKGISISNRQYYGTYEA